MAQRRPRPAGQDSCHPTTSGIEQRVSDGIDPAVDPVKPPICKADLHGPTRDPRREHLPPRHKTMLPTRKPSQHPIHPTPCLIRRAFATHTVVNARFANSSCGHATTLDDRYAYVARWACRKRNAKEAPARRYRLWL